VAGNYQILAQQAVTEFIPPDKTRVLHEITAQAIPSGVVFPFRFKPVDYFPQGVDLTLHDVAQWLNKLAAHPGVVAVSLEHDVDGSNMIAVTWRVTVETPSGDSQDDVILSWTEAIGLNGYPKLDKAIKNMEEIEAL
jgi:hypothetical protein